MAAGAHRQDQSFPWRSAPPAASGSASPMVGRRDLITPNPKLKILDQVREVMRLEKVEG